MSAAWVEPYDPDNPQVDAVLADDAVLDDIAAMGGDEADRFAALLAYVQATAAMPRAPWWQRVWPRRGRHALRRTGRARSWSMGGRR